jgi:predicted double-glycine peptidase
VSHQDPIAVAPLPGNLVQVPVVTQREDFSCGPAATLALLRFWRPDAFAAVEESALYAPLETTDERGTEPEPIAELFRTNGLEAHYRHGNVTVADLERAVDAGEPPIVDLQAWTDHPIPYRETWDAGHYVVMVGYDDERLYFADPSTMTPHGYVFLPRVELDERWHDLAGMSDDRVERMAIFVRGSVRRSLDSAPPAGAVKLL